jgi:hypothetical protein
VKRTREERVTALAAKRPAGLRVEVDRHEADDPDALRDVARLLVALLTVPRVVDAGQR